MTLLTITATDSTGASPSATVINTEKVQTIVRDKRAGCRLVVGQRTMWCVQPFESFTDLLPHLPDLALANIAISAGVVEQRIINLRHIELIVPAPVRAVLPAGSPPNTAIISQVPVNAKALAYFGMGLPVAIADDVEALSAAWSAIMVPTPAKEIKDSDPVVLLDDVQAPRA